MEFIENTANSMPARRPWNRGKLVGAKPPLRPKHVWSIRTRLQLENKRRDLALFNLAIDSKLRGCDLISIMVEDVAPRGCCLDRATVRQKKTGHPVKFEMTEQNHGSRLTITCCRQRGCPASRFSLVGGKAEVLQRGSTPGSCPIGFRTSVLIQAYTAHTPFAEPRPRSSTSEPGTFAPYNSCSAIPRSRAPCAISASRSMTHWL